MSAGRTSGPSGRSGVGPASELSSQTSRMPRATSGADIPSALADLPALPRKAGEPSIGADDQISGAAAARLFGETGQRPAQPATTIRKTPDPIQRRVLAHRSAGPAPSASASASASQSAPQSAATDTAEPPPERSQKQTLTQQLRSVQPPDVARQAINELNVLASELITVAGELELSGLARMHSHEYLDTVRRYTDLARQAWLSVAAERLEQDGATSEYRQQVVGIARDITRLRRESEVAASNKQFPLPQRRPYLWRIRIDTIGRALEAWQGALTAPADPLRMGVALFALRGAINGATIPMVEYSLLNLLRLAALWLTPLSGVAAGLASVASVLARHPVTATSYAVVMLLAFMLWTTLLMLTSRGRVTLQETLAGICFSRTRSASNGRGGSRLVAAALRGWLALVGGAGALLTLGALVGSGLAIDRLNLLAPVLQGLPMAPGSSLKLAAEARGLMAAPAGLVASATLGALAVPTFLISAGRFAREMGSSRRWVASARRYALAPALGTVAYLTGALVAGAWLLADRLRLTHMTLMKLPAFPGGAPLILSGRTLLLALALALPYLIAIELPFRLGLEAWRRVWLRDLQSRRATIEAHVRRLSAPDPRTGVPDTGAETLRAMQYDLVLLQFYTARITEAERASGSPFGIGGTLALLCIVLVGAALFDVSAHLLNLAQSLHLTF